MPAQKPPVQSPSAVVVHAPVSGSAQCGYALPTRWRVSSMRFCILPIASVHTGMIALRSIQSRITDVVGESHARRPPPSSPPLIYSKSAFGALDQTRTAGYSLPVSQLVPSQRGPASLTAFGFAFFGLLGSSQQRAAVATARASRQFSAADAGQMCSAACAARNVSASARSRLVRLKKAFSPTAAIEVRMIPSPKIGFS